MMDRNYERLAMIEEKLARLDEGQVVIFKKLDVIHKLLFGQMESEVSREPLVTQVARNSSFRHTWGRAMWGVLAAFSSLLTGVVLLWLKGWLKL